MFDVEAAKAAVHAIRLLMDENQERLIEVDSALGDGDLGLTMTKAFRTADEQLSDSDESDIGTFLAKAGMIMAKAAPSTMGTLVATGFMRGGKMVKDKTELSASDIASFFRAFSDGIIERGKTKPGNKTIVDVVDPVATALEEAAARGDGVGALVEAAESAASMGEEAARQMMSQHGKAAVYREQTIGKPDPGATAGVLIVRGFFEPVRSMNR
ncbi:MAG: dihydroxyacetone kinase subunit L [Spirochaetaceae bacterium]|nr:MAG: dihydroxyacetone kinase subunit L [Spirochaetaceae bacterium]